MVETLLDIRSILKMKRFNRDGGTVYDPPHTVNGAPEALVDRTGLALESADRTRRSTVPGSTCRSTCRGQRAGQSAGGNVPGSTCRSTCRGQRAGVNVPVNVPGSTCRGQRAGVNVPVNVPESTCRG